MSQLLCMLKGCFWRKVLEAMAHSLENIVFDIHCMIERGHSNPHVTTAHIFRIQFQSCDELILLTMTNILSSWKSS